MPSEIEYPPEDDEPMAETGAHGTQITLLSEQLKALFRDDPHICVATDVFIYYREGDSQAKVAPDILVAHGVRERQPRSSYFTWIEGKPPDVVFEFLSGRTATRDRQVKPDLYLLEIGVTEQFLWQPRPDRRREFRGWRLIDGEAVAITAEPFILATEEVVLAYYCEVLDLWLVEERVPEARLLRFYYPQGTPVPTLAEALDQIRAAQERVVESMSQAMAAEERATQEAAARTAAEERATQEAAARTAAEERAAQEAAARTAAEERAAEAEERALQEAAARAAAEEELARMREELARMRGKA
jgi:Uma2 family endonuclease